MSAPPFKFLTPGPIHMPAIGLSLSSDGFLNHLGERIRLFDTQGMCAGDRVFIGHGNCVDFFVDLLATWALGGCVVPLDPKLTPFEMQNLVRAARPRFFLDATGCSTVYEPILKEEAIALIKTGLRDHGSNPVERQQDILAQLNAAMGDALILFTSGSTDEPKGVVHTHDSLRAKWRTLSSEIAPDTLQRSMCMLPTHFGHGLICNALFPWLSGNNLFLLPPFSPQSLLSLGELLTRHEITFLSSVPAVWQLALKGRPPTKSKLLEVFCGSAPLSEDLWKKVADWCGGAMVRNVYGITETGSWIAGPKGEAVAADGLVGEPWGSRFAIMPGGSIEYCPSRNKPCADGQIGHVWVKTDSLMKGYLDRDDLTSQMVSDGWFSTGDIGFIDVEGQLFLKGRERDEINRGGIKIYTAEIETVVTSFPSVQEACSFACQDQLYGQAVGVALVIETKDPAELKKLYFWTAARLADYKVPSNWFLLDAIPKTDRGKINRSNLANYCADRTPLDMARILGTTP